MDPLTPNNRINTFTGDWLNGWSWNPFSWVACVWFSSQANIHSWSSNRHRTCLKNCHSTGAIFPHIYEIDSRGNISSKVSVVYLSAIHNTLSSYDPWCTFVIFWPRISLTSHQQHNGFSSNPQYRNGAKNLEYETKFLKIKGRGIFPISCKSGK